MASNNIQQQPQRKNAQQGNGLTLKSIVSFAVSKWYWFVISLVITMSVAVIYLMRTTPEYTRTASLLIKNEDKNGTAGTSIDMSELGIVQKNTNLENEIRIVKSPALMKEVVGRLDLNDTYTVRKDLRNEMLYRRSPVLFVDKDTVGASISFDFTLNDNNVIDIRNLTLKTGFGQTIKIGDNRLAVVKPEWNSSDLIGETVHYEHVPVHDMADELSKRVSAVLGNEKSSIIDISITCPSIKEADDILVTLIQVYNERWILDKNRVAISTSEFINERLNVIEKELGNVDSDISTYKSEHLLPDIGAATSMYMAQSSEAEAAIIDLHNQISVAEMVKNQLQQTVADKHRDSQRRHRECHPAIQYDSIGAQSPPRVHQRGESCSKGQDTGIEDA